MKQNTCFVYNDAVTCTFLNKVLYKRRGCCYGLKFFPTQTNAFLFCWRENGRQADNLQQMGFTFLVNTESFCCKTAEKVLRTNPPQWNELLWNIVKILTETHWLRTPLKNSLSFINNIFFFASNQQHGWWISDWLVRYCLLDWDSIKNLKRKKIRPL